MTNYSLTVTQFRRHSPLNSYLVLFLKNLFCFKINSFQLNNIYIYHLFTSKQIKIVFHYLSVFPFDFGFESFLYKQNILKGFERIESSMQTHTQWFSIANTVDCYLRTFLSVYCIYMLLSYLFEILIIHWACRYIVCV